MTLIVTARQQRFLGWEISHRGFYVPGSREPSTLFKTFDLTFHVCISTENEGILSSPKEVLDD